MEAILHANKDKGANGEAHRKVNSFYKEYSVISFNQGTFENPVVLRLYATNTRVYACLWVHQPGCYLSGSGFAGGHGYHKASAAALVAINAAGINLSENIDGVGDNAIVDALKAIAVALGCVNFTVHEAHA